MKKLILITTILLISNLVTAQNIIENNSFEYWTDETPDHWTKVGTASKIIKSSAYKHSGNYSCSFKDPTGSYASRGVHSDQIIVNEGDYYDLWGWFFVENEGEGNIDDTKLRLRVFWYESDGTEISSDPDQIGWNVDSFDSWFIKEINNIQAPSNTSYAIIAIDCCENENNNNDVFIDDIQFGDTGTLPVALSSFTAEYISSIPTISWETQTEVDNLGFYLYRNIENHFSDALCISNLIQGHGTTTSPQHYTYYDDIENAQIGDTYYYWLESVDLSGTITHYNVVASLTITGEEPDNDDNLLLENSILSQSQPNPVNVKKDLNTKISFNLPEIYHVVIDIYNIQGKLMKNIFNNKVKEGIATWDGKDENGNLQASGIYLYRMKIENKLDITKKLLLLD